MLKLFVVYAHLIATCLALGMVLTLDWRLFRMRDQVLASADISKLTLTQRIASASLIFLWASGALLVWLGYAEAPANYLTNPKLWAKVSVVVTLTINGLFLHAIAFPKIRVGTVLMRLATRERLWFGAMGAVSSVSWLFAAFLGVARPWNYTMPYSVVMSIFGGLLLLAVLGAIVFMLVPSFHRADLRQQPA
jgi:hypothetical protein